MTDMTTEQALRKLLATAEENPFCPVGHLVEHGLGGADALRAALSRPADTEASRTLDALIALASGDDGLPEDMRADVERLRASLSRPAVPEGYKLVPETMPDWGAAPPGATHYQPHQDAYYKRVSASEWYVWSRMNDREPMRWHPSLGTGDNAEWVVRPAEQHPDDAAVDQFAQVMKAKLAKARAKGRSGWDDPAQCSPEYLADLLAGHVRKGNDGNFVDVANLAMMLHQRGAAPSVMPDAIRRSTAEESLTTEQTDDETLDGLTERRVQRLLYQRFMAGGSHMVAVPNTSLYGWEADMLTVTKAGFVHEYEIKVSRADLLRELKAVREAHELERDQWASRSTKCWRHSVLAGLLEPPPFYSGQRAQEWRDRALSRRPNYFWLVVREGICEPDEIPDYAGLLVVREVVRRQVKMLVLHQARKARRIHSHKLDADRALRLAGHACYRFWDHAFPRLGKAERDALRERVKELVEIIGDIKRWDISNLLLGIPHPLRKRMQAVLAAMQEGEA